jgi:lipid II:glycine glycyltransferase (peptidoglycan interpeptide bridge formation enzyme)
MKFTSVDRSTQWNSFVNQNNGHPLQLWEWGQLKSEFHWEAERIQIFKSNRKDAPVIGGFQLLKRSLPRPFHATYYIPRGPIILDGETKRVFEGLASYAQTELRKTGMLLQIEPNLLESEVDSEKLNLGKATAKTILLPQTVQLDLSKTEPELFKAMSKKTRQYINKSSSYGAEIYLATSLDEVKTCYQLYESTAAKDKFAIHDVAYYEAIFNTLKDYSKLYVAKYQSKIIAFLWNIENPNYSFELYAGATNLAYNMRLNYILKWQAIKAAREAGVKIYDLNGLLNDGIAQFKLGFSGNKSTELIGTFERSLSAKSMLYKIALPAGKKLLAK